MANPNLTESAWTRAVAESARIYPTIGYGVAATLTTIIFGSVAAVAAAGEDTTNQIAYPIVGGALALAMTFVALFAIQLGAAPVRQRNDLREAWKAPEKVQSVNVPLTLRNHHRKGVELRHRFSGAMIGRAAQQELEQWADGVVDFMGPKLPESEVEDFLKAGEAEGSPLKRHIERLDTLQTIINGLS